jgi:hypothetical protein
MPEAVKGGLFVGAAVVTGILVGFIVAPLVGAERSTAKRPRAHAVLLPKMPNVIGQRLDEAGGELRRRKVRYVTDAPDFVEQLVPSIMEVCESEPGPGSSVRGRARLRTAVAGTCGI